MKSIFKTIIILAVIIVGWWLISPLFINQNVDEALPVETQDPQEIEEVIDILEEEDDIIIGQDVVIDEPMMETSENQEQSVELIGTFVDGERNYQGEGDVLLVTDGDSQFLRFENFSVTNGPDLFVTLNKGTDPKGEHVIVDALKGNQGNQNYDISQYDLSEYQSVSIYCRAFSREFATAQL
jgi:hypothetical protein